LAGGLRLPLGRDDWSRCARIPAAPAACSTPGARSSADHQSEVASARRLPGLFSAHTHGRFPESERGVDPARGLRACLARARGDSTGLAPGRGPLQRRRSGHALSGSPSGLEAPRRAGWTIPVRNPHSDGSLGNIRLAERPVPAQFAAGARRRSAERSRRPGRLSGRRQPELRAVASLFPETITSRGRAAGSGHCGVGDLRAKRVDLGLPGRARAPMAACVARARCAEAELASVSGSSLPDATEAWLPTHRRVLRTIHAPARRDRAARRADEARDSFDRPSRELVDSGHLAAHAACAHLCSQTTPVPTLAATALLVDARGRRAGDSRGDAWAAVASGGKVRRRPPSPRSR